MSNTPLKHTDWYKVSHDTFMKEGTTQIYSNLTPRSDKYANFVPEYNDGKVVFFGLTYFIKNYLLKEWNDNFFNVPKAEAVGKFQRRIDNALGKNAITTEHMEELWELGRLPITIKALPEGSKVKPGVPQLVIYNTHENFAWLTNYLETVMSCEMWKPSTSATTANHYLNIMKAFADKTVGNYEHIPFQCHDFSFRGMSGRHDAALSGAAHLLSFSGTDTISAIDLLEDYYGANTDTTLVGTSVPASEHSVTSLGTSVDGEFETIKDWVTNKFPTGIVSIVSDTYDYWKVLTEYMPQLKDDILARKENDLGMSKVVVRPDSGDPADIICGDFKFTEYDLIEDAIDCERDNVWDAAAADCEGRYNVGSDKYNVFVKVDQTYYKLTYFVEYNRHDKTYYYVDSISSEPTVTEIEPTPQNKGSIELLWDTFGGTVNELGYKVLNPKVGLIYGDSITPERAVDILSRLEKKGFASSNVVFGVGSFTYQFVTRDTFGYAVKATAAIVNGEKKEIFKDPVTDQGKKSAKGYLRVEKENGEYVLLDQQKDATMSGELKHAFVDGSLDIFYEASNTLEKIKERLQ